MDTNTTMASTLLAAQTRQAARTRLSLEERLAAMDAQEGQASRGSNHKSTPAAPVSPPPPPPLTTTATTVTTTTAEDKIWAGTDLRTYCADCGERFATMFRPAHIPPSWLDGLERSGDNPDLCCSCRGAVDVSPRPSASPRPAAEEQPVPDSWEQEAEEPSPPPPAWVGTDADPSASCFVCLGPIVDPATLSCGHTACIGCLSMVTENHSDCPCNQRDCPTRTWTPDGTHSTTCPMCRQEHRAELGISMMLRDLLDLVHSTDPDWPATVLEGRKQQAEQLASGGRVDAAHAAYRRALATPTVTPVDKAELEQRIAALSEQAEAERLQPEAERLLAEAERLRAEAERLQAERQQAERLQAERLRLRLSLELPPRVQRVLGTLDPPALTQSLAVRLAAQQTRHVEAATSPLGPDLPGADVAQAIVPLPRSVAGRVIGAGQSHLRAIELTVRRATGERNIRLAVPPRTRDGDDTFVLCEAPSTTTGERAVDVASRAVSDRIAHFVGVIGERRHSQQRGGAFQT